MIFDSPKIKLKKKNLSLPLSSPLPLYTLILSLPLSPLSPASEIKKKDSKLKNPP
jgi:hypothetical protein